MASKRKWFELPEHEQPFVLRFRDVGSIRIVGLDKAQRTWDYLSRMYTPTTSRPA
jgi:hypothetical protein